MISSPKVVSSFFFSFLIVAIVGCSNILTNENSTDSADTVFPIKGSDYNLKLTLCRGVSKTTGATLFAGNTFPIGEKERVTAFLEFSNYQDIKQPQMIHIDWIDQNDYSFYKKSSVFTLCDTLNTLQSSIASGQESRQPGNYKVKVYYFRELIAEKSFRMIAEDTYNDSIARQIGATLVFFKNTNKLTGERQGIDTVFSCAKKSWVNAAVDFRNRPVCDDEIKFSMEWVLNDTATVYNKRLVFNTSDSVYLVKSAISVAPEKRIPGKYTVNVYWFQQLIAQKSFILIPEQIAIKTPKPLVNKNIIVLCQKIDKQTGEKTGVGTSFTIAENGRVTALIDLTKVRIDRKKKLSVQWFNPEGKAFFKKSIDLSEEDSFSEITSTISTEAKSRAPGTYFIRVFQTDELIAEKEFELLTE